VEQAMLAMAELGRLHAPLLGQSAMADVEWLNRESPMNQALIAQLYTGFIDRYGDQIEPAHREVCERLVGGFDAFLVQEAAADRIDGLVHGDYRLDNMLFGQQGADRPLTVVDWQTVTWGPATTDVAYFLGCALADDIRRDNYDALLGAYHDALGPEAALSRDDVREGVRRQGFFGVMMAIVSSMLVERTARGDEMFMTMLRRHSQHVIDTDALATLPRPAAPEPLRPSAIDESAHEPGTEPMWSESWYADFVDESQGIGGWFRLGIIPNENRAWVNALLCGPGIPTLAVNDFEVALPDEAAAVVTDAIELTHAATEPLQTYHVRLRGSGQAYDEPSALLRGEAGRAVELSMDLTWTTTGTPYQYRLTPRYEIPCTVSGTVVADGRVLDVASVPGQRDHSWGVRDWWSMDWVWSALHLQDGTHLHGVDLRIPGAPPIGVGYVQPPDGPLVELQSVSAREEFGDDGLPVATELTLAPGDITATVDIRGHAPVLLTATDGRVSQFPRAWATVTTADGRAGVGWLEWNRNPR
jgi:Ecdysteroid kinase-like family